MLTRPNEICSNDEIEDLDLDRLRTYLQALPCCVLGNDRETPGDSPNIVIVGPGAEVLRTLDSRGWDLTETMRAGTAWRTAVSSVFKSRYRTSPVSPLVLFDRPQDAAFQKTRRTVDERNHMRLWRASVKLHGPPVWVGQISRDIGIKLSAQTLVTHRIDSMVDETRTYLLLDVIESERLAAFGFVAGVWPASVAEPHYNYTRDPYYTDGLRSVMILSEVPVAFGAVEQLHWEPLPKESIFEPPGQSPKPRMAPQRPGHRG